MKRVALPSISAGVLDFFFVGALLCVTAFMLANEPRWNFAGRDTLVYAVAADMWSHGAVPYRDFIDHKPPGVYLVYRAFFFLGGRSPRAIWVGMTFLAAVAASFLYVGLRLTGRAACAVVAAAALFLLIVTDTLGLGLASQNNCETLATFWGALAFAWALVHERSARALAAVLAGACFAAAVLSKQTGAVWLLPLGVHLATAAHRQLSGRERIRHGLKALAGFALGAAVVAGACLAYFAAHGALGPFYEWVLARNFVYARPAAAAPLHYHWAVLTETYHWFLPKIASRDGLPFAVALVVLALASLHRRGYLARLVILWCIAGFAGACAGLGVQSHYLVLLFLPLALALGAAWEWLLGFAPERARPAWFRMLLAAGLCEIAFAPSLRVLGGQMRGERTMIRSMQADPMYRLGRDVAREAQPGDRMLAFGDPFDALFYSGLQPPGRYIYYPNAALSPNPDDYMRELRATEPRFVYVGSDTYGAFLPGPRGVQGMLRAYLDESYELWLDIGPGKVYRRKP